MQPLSVTKFSSALLYAHIHSKAMLPKPRTKLKPTNDAQARARDSSSLGPSPLRAMILPDAPSGSGIRSPRLDRNDKDDELFHD